MPHWLDATFIAFVAFSLFFALLLYLKVPAMILGALDARSNEIAKELHEARRLREEAEKLHAEYAAKRAAAEAEAKDIVATAKEQAALVAEETRASMQAAMARRERQADDRIAAAEKMIRDRMSDSAQAGLVQDGAADLKRKFG